MADVCIPVVDFRPLTLDEDNISFDSDQKVQEVASQICDAFSNIGFVYLKNHGISDEEIAKVRDVADKFFELPVSEKQKCARPTDGSGNYGWVALERESLNPDRPADLKEAFNIDNTVSKSESGHNLKWPTATVPEMESTVKNLYDRCVKLSFRILKVIGIALKLQNSNLIAEAHSCLGKVGNTSTLRILYYPPIPDSTVIKKDQIRCGEHSDYGAITLLFQDDLHNSGLQVLPVHGEYIDAPYIPGCVLVNIGDLMQRWTADKLRSTKHRVLIPPNQITRNKSRKSMAFFVHPDDNFLVECLDGSNKYPGITGEDYLKERFAATYKNN